VGITAGSREVPGRNACDRRHTYCTTTIIIIIIQTTLYKSDPNCQKNKKKNRATAQNVCSTTLDTCREIGVILDKEEWHEYLRACTEITRNESRK